MFYTSQKILQLMPARPGWQAVYWHRESQDKDHEGRAWHSEPVECLALIEETREGKTDQSIVGVVKGSWDIAEFKLLSDDETDFLGYTHADDPYDWQAEALERRA